MKWLKVIHNLACLHLRGARTIFAGVDAYRRVDEAYFGTGINEQAFR